MSAGPPAAPPVTADQERVRAAFKRAGHYPELGVIAELAALLCTVRVEATEAAQRDLTDAHATKDFILETCDEVSDLLGTPRRNGDALVEAIRALRVKKDALQAQLDEAQESLDLVKIMHVEEMKMREKSDRERAEAQGVAHTEFTIAAEGRRQRGALAAQLATAEGQVARLTVERDANANWPEMYRMYSELVSTEKIARREAEASVAALREALEEAHDQAESAWSKQSDEHMTHALYFIAEHADKVLTDTHEAATAFVERVREEGRRQGRQEAWTRAHAVDIEHDERVRAEERERCAKVAKVHHGAAARRRKELGQKLGRFDPEAQADIVAEERGEDIAADEIERAIRALGPERDS